MSKNDKRNFITPPSGLSFQIVPNSQNFPQEARGLSPGRNAGSRKFLILAQTQPNHAHSFRLRYIQPL
nr:MAG TPA: hypothetical protein [Caudoviricetes sp.]